MQAEHIAQLQAEIADIRDRLDSGEYQGMDDMLQSWLDKRESALAEAING